MAMACRHDRHRPRSSTQLTTGMLSYQRMADAAPGQWEPGRTSDSRRGTR